MSSTDARGAGPPTISSLLVPLDGSYEAEAAVPVAARLAKRIGARLELFSAVNEANQITERERELAGVSASDVLVERSVVVEADAISAITHAASQPGRQVCLATQGRGRSAAVLGSVALGTLQSSNQPILCVGPRLGHTTSDAPSVGIVVCLDGSEHSEAAIGPAVQWAHLLNEPLTLLTAVEDAPPPLEGRRPNRSFSVEDPDAYLAGQVQALADRVSSVATRIVTDPLNPGGAVQSLLSQEASTMVVAGTRGRGGIARAVLGSVAAAIVQHSAAPVLLVPANA